MDCDDAGGLGTRKRRKRNKDVRILEKSIPMDHEDGEENMEGDRLSNLPDDLIHKILSLISIKHAVQTSVLSSRWRYIWTSMSDLNLSTKDFRRLPRFSKFVKHFLSGRDDKKEVFSLNLTFRGKVSQEAVQTILDYAFSHNVQHLNITCLPGHMYCLADFPHSLFTSQFLKHFTFSGRVLTYPVTITPAWVLPSITTLSLSFYDAECAGLFAKCANLKNLTLKDCSYLNSFGRLNSFSIHHPGLSSLTLEDGSECVNVVTPQLKNLTIKFWRGVNLISAPNLTSLYYKDHYYQYKDNEGGPLQLPTDLRHVEKVDIIITSDDGSKAYTHKIVRLLQQLHRVKYLTLSLELVKHLSSSVEAILHQNSPFVNLKSLKVYPFYVSAFSPLEQGEQDIMPTEVKNYLLGGSLGATFTMVQYEEIRAVEIVRSAEDLMRQLEDMLKNNFETNISHIEKAPTASAQPDDPVQLLWEINLYLTLLPTSHWAREKLQPRYSGLCVEVKKNAEERMQIQNDGNLLNNMTNILLLTDVSSCFGAC